MRKMRKDMEKNKNIHSDTFRTKKFVPRTPAFAFVSGLLLHGEQVALVSSCGTDSHQIQRPSKHQEPQGKKDLIAWSMSQNAF